MKKQTKKIIAFDLDGTLIDSSHRQNGTLEFWIQNSTEDKIFQDKILPLIHAYKKIKSLNETYRKRKGIEPYMIICVTARTMKKEDFEFLKKNHLEFEHILFRNPEEDQKFKDHELKHLKLKNFFDFLKTKEISFKPYAAFDDIHHNLEVFKEYGFRAFNAIELNQKISSKI